MIEVGELRKDLKKFKDGDVLLTSAEFAKTHGYAPSSMRVMIRRGQIGPVIKIGNEWFIPENSEIMLKQRSKKSEIKLIGMADF